MPRRRAVALVAALAFGAAGIWVSVHAGGHRDLDRFVTNHDWFGLRDAMTNPNQKDAPRDIYRAWLAAVFHRDADAVRYAESAARSSRDNGDANEVLCRVFDRQGRYREALAAALAARAARHQSEEKDEFVSEEALWKAVASWPSPSVETRQPSRLHGSRIDDGVMLPVLIDNQSGEYPIDTGTSDSSVTPEEATRLGLEVVHLPGYVITDANGVDMPADVALVKSLVIGGVRLRNVLFHVLPDDLPGRGLIGMNVLELLETVRWNEAGEIEVGFDSPGFDYARANLCLDDISESPITAGSIQGKPVRIYIDSGSDETDFMPLFGSEFRSVARSAKTSEMTGHGSSGVHKWKTLDLPDVRIRLAGGEFLAEESVLLSDDYPLPVENTHVWLGFDALAKGASLDFTAMRFSVR